MADLQPSLQENSVVEATATTSSTLSETPTNSIVADANVTSATMQEGSGPHASATSENNQQSQEDISSVAEKTTSSNTTFPKQTGNAWGIKTNPTDSIPQSIDNSTNNKKRSNNTLLPVEESTSDVANNSDSDIDGNIASKPKFADIMAEQESKKGVVAKTKVSFSQEVESEEERMMRLAIEASLQSQQEATHGFPSSQATKMPASALKNCGSDTTSFTTKSCSQNVSFSSSNFAYDEGDDMDEDMRMAIALSLKEAEGGGDNSCYASAAVSGSYGDSDSGDVKDDKMEEGEDDRKPSALPKKEETVGLMEEEERKPAAVEMGSDAANGSGRESSQSAYAIYPAAASAAGTCLFDSAPAAASTATAAAAITPPSDESEQLAQALHHAELAEYDASKTANDAAEAASLQLAMQLQGEEDARHDLKHDAEAARLKRAEMCHGGSGGSVGVRTVGREEFNSLKIDNDDGDGRMVGRRREEERGVGKLLSGKNYYGDDDNMMGNVLGGNYDNETDDYYYYENDRLKGNDTQQDHDLDDEDGNDGIRMNSQSSSSNWKRLDKDTFIGPNNEIRTKHDPELKHRSNAVNLLGSHGAKHKDAYNESSDNKKSVSVSDRAYNAFRRAESRQAGYKKGVARQGHGRAENMNAGKTRGGAMDDNARLHISAAISAGLIDNCNGVVKEGKEALVYHADGGWKGRQDDGAEEEVSVAHSPDGTLETIGSDGYDVAVKIFKRISDFKGRGSYVDGDPRYHKQKFKTNDQRDQVVLWTEKELRNLVRAHRAGLAVPKPLYQKENILFMRFLGDNGWPSPQLKEIDIKKGSEKWTTFYGQTLVAIRRLYHCARLVHADLSEYNLLICPSWQASHGHLVAPDERTVDDETLQVVLIDFGQAVDIGHPSAEAWLRRDLSTVRDFFVRQGIKTLSNEVAEQFVTDPFEETNDAKNGTEPTDDGTTGINESEVDSNHMKGARKTENKNWRHTKRGWDDKKEMENLQGLLPR
mmetsp:Transcript_15239/g.27681  ORF Transcript_15239/g.27681 Transcript_15239/m.27681 type:complete len:992 (-) Transcript_15239:185-3160(-)|eukprot:CAMPEP_0201898902 /NCGR_PEP_ID=MMETSP0902-20130614/49390_1 /ASSEMBLY_ACC=CAM_ASM_000551 /TAXON_ID=420261 /ORGANISM="Thalassiosira antarctica, Strain CCMP982" /LENGTH=991 /DNA_ID=CAMNT_0048432175 /DNA_START=200 /DNA_END=3178 /DNA_ORIENTATION=-